MADASVAAYIAQPRNILRNLSAELASHYVIAVDNLGYSAQLVFRKLVGSYTFVNAGLFQNLF
jgi:hypothetical protein